MSIESEISRIKTGVAGAYDVVEELGGDLPDEKTVDNLSDSIATIFGSGSNGNMIINWDFRKPVNRNGKTSYTISTAGGDNYESSIDRWAISGTGSLVVADGSIIIARTSNLILKQFFDNQQSLAGYDVTVSFLMSGNAKIVLKIDDTYPKDVYYDDESIGVATFTYTFPDEFSGFWLMIQPQSDDPVTLYACKLEMGTKQTLAKQDENGDWKIIDPPDYDLQYALCCQYNQIDGSFVGNGNKLSGKHDNLLDNACFLYPVNRNGRTSYNGKNGYNSETTIDRWNGYVYQSATVKVDLTSDGLTITRTGTGYSGITQPIVNADWWNTSIAGNIVTTSILLSDGTLYSNSYIVPTIPTTKFISLCAFPNGAVYLYGGNIVVVLTGGTSITIKAIKMELGSVQTLAERSNGVWNLIDVPTYAQEYLRTAVFDTNTSEFGGLRIHGQNVFRNWYFRNPVNRNGKTVYSESGETIDGWKFLFANTDTSGSIELLDSGIKITKNKGNYVTIRQQIPEETLTFLDGKTITASILLSDGTLITGSLAYSKSSTDWKYICWSNANGCTIGIQTQPVIGFHIVFVEGLCIIQAVKLEVGSTQTLARQDADGKWELIDPPNYGLQYALCSLYSPTNGEFVGSQHSNPNLLDNWCFADPINRQGETEYAQPGYTIDRWRLQTDSTAVNLVSEGLFLDPKDASSVMILSQNFTGLSRFFEKPITTSILTSDGFATKTVKFSKPSGTNIVDTANATVGKLTIDIYANVSDIQNDVFRVRVISVNGNTGIVKAVKFEQGSVQTLAHKEGDTWVLNDPFDYSAEYLKCSLYSPITGEFIGSQHSNPNLLDNWYFVDPINQKGETEYQNTTSSIYGVDRWQLDWNSSMQLTGSTGIKNNGGMFQKLDKDVDDFIRNKTVTLSMLSANNLYTFTCTPINTSVARPDSILRLLYNYSSHTGFSFSITNMEDPIIAVKLELGSVQTLAHKEGDTWILNDPPPNKQQELAKCQRYMFVNGRRSFINLGTVYYSTQTKSNIQMIIPVPMRISYPSVKFDGNFRIVDASSGQEKITNYKDSDIEVSYPRNIGSVVNTGLHNVVIGAGGVAYLDTADENSKLIIDANL